MSGAECRATELEPPVYTVGVRYRLPGGGALRTACPKGYAYDLGAADLLLAATPAYRELRRQRGAEMCLEEIAVTGRRCLFRGGRGPRRRDPHLLPRPLARLRRRRAPGELRLRRVAQPPARLALKKSTVRSQASLAAASL